MESVARNAPCPCGSGKKYKRCCLEAEEAATSAGGVRRGPLAVAVLGVVGAAVLFFTHGFDTAGPVAAGSVVVAVALTVFTDPPPPKGGSGGDPAGMNFGR
ncbi:MAG: SEC-C metal-binding domain-containing protein [Myxococcota bacterium]